MVVERNFKRRYANSFFGIYDAKTDDFVGFLVDMTVAGLKLESSSPFDIDALYRFRMDLPTEIEGSAQITFCARSVWSKPLEKRGQHETGFEMHDLPDNELKKIVNLIEGSLFNDTENILRINLSRI